MWMSCMLIKFSHIHTRAHTERITCIHVGLPPMHGQVSSIGGERQLSDCRNRNCDARSASMEGYIGDDDDDNNNTNNNNNNNNTFYLYNTF